MADTPMDSVEKKHGQSEQKMKRKFEAEGRLQDMAAVRSKLGCLKDVAKVYSAPRIVTVAEAAGLRGGFSLDLTAPSPDGHIWDFSIHANRVKAQKLLNEQKPYVLIGSPRAQHSATCRTSMHSDQEEQRV